MNVLWVLVACGSGSSDQGNGAELAPAPPPPPPPASIEGALQTCLEKDPERTSEASVACVQEAVAAWKVRVREGEAALLAATDDATDPLVRASQERWLAFRAADAALGEAVRSQRPSASVLDAAFEVLGATRDRALRLERYLAAVRGEPEPPELSEHSIDADLQSCLRKQEGRALCATAAEGAWDKEIALRLGTLRAILGGDAAERAQTAWDAYRAADAPLVGALLTDPILAGRERASLVERRAEALGELVDQLKNSGGGADQ